MQGINNFRLALPKGKGDLWRDVIGISWPAFVELLMVTLFGMVDMMMVGRLGPASITAIGLTVQPFLLLLSIFAAVNVGTTTIVAWKIGAGKSEDAQEVTRQIIVANFFLGVIMCLIGVLWAPSLVEFMGAGPDTKELAIRYFQLISLGLIFQGVAMGVTASLRGAGDTRIPMLYNIGSNLLNIFGNYVLIYGRLGFPKLGVAGAAISTTVSRAIACLAGLCVLYFWHGSKIKLDFKTPFRIDFGQIKEVFSIGLPAAFEQVILRTGLIFFSRIVSALGTNIYAAHQIALGLSELSFAPAMAFGVAATTLVGQSLGAEDEERAMVYARITQRLAIMTACFIGLLFLLFSHSLARLYTTDLAVIAMAGTVLKIMALAQPGESTQVALAGALRGAGDTVYPLISSLFGIWGFRVALGYLFVNVFNWGLVGAWVAMSLDQYMRAAVVSYRFRSGKWKEIRQLKVSKESELKV